jgi:transposase
LDANTIKEHRWFFNTKFISEAWYATHYHARSLEKDTLFLFCGRRRDRLKGLLWCGDRFILLYIRLADGRFQWPRTADEARHISGRQFVQLMEGYSIDPSIGKPVSQPAPAIRKRS